MWMHRDFYIFWFALTVFSENPQNFVGIFGCCCMLSRWVQRDPQVSFLSSSCQLSVQHCVSMAWIILPRCIHYIYLDRIICHFFSALSQLCIISLEFISTCECVIWLPAGIQYHLWTETHSCIPSFCRSLMKILNKTNSLRYSAAYSLSWKVAKAL